MIRPPVSTIVMTMASVLEVFVTVRKASLVMPATLMLVLIVAAIMAFAKRECVCVTLTTQGLTVV